MLLMLGSWPFHPSRNDTETTGTFIPSSSSSTSLTSSLPSPPPSPFPSLFSTFFSLFFLQPLSLTLASLMADAHSGNFLGLLSIIIFSGWGCQPCAQPHSGGPGYNFRLCSPVEVGKWLRSPPCLLIVGHSLSGSSAETCIAGVTLPVAILLVGSPQLNRSMQSSLPGLTWTIEKAVPPQGGL